jgi:hypothetical protein
MTIAVCSSCGKIKFGAWTPCSECDHDPETLEDMAKSLMLSDNFYSQEELEQFSVRLQRGEAWRFDEVAMQKVIEELMEAEQKVLEDQSS